MGALDGEIWVCAECRSINNARAKQCYNCRTPRDLAAVDPASIEGTGHGKLRDVALPTFESPRPYAIVASFLILVVALMQIVSTVNVSRLITQLCSGQVTDCPCTMPWLSGPPLWGQTASSAYQPVFAWKTAIQA